MAVAPFLAPSFSFLAPVACFCCLPGEKVQNLLPALWSFLFLPYFCKKPIFKQIYAMKYPIGIQSFDKIINGDYVYVDKTDLVYSLVKEGTIYFLGRPRRFGKSLLVSTLEHYFLGHKELFKGLKIDSLEKDWLEYPVFHIDFNGRRTDRNICWRTGTGGLCGHSIRYSRRRMRICSSCC